MIDHKKVAIIDYGLGNLWSVQSAIKYLGVDCYFADHPKNLIGATHVVLPGVGSFRVAMDLLKSSGFEEALKEGAQGENFNLLGICLGMQVLGTYGEEDGGCEGLGLINSQVLAFDKKLLNGRKVPHVGFDLVSTDKQQGLFCGLPEKADFYFTHSYFMEIEGAVQTHGVCDYGHKFLAAFDHGIVSGTQFHPEKSQTNGLILLKNFLKK